MPQLAASSFGWTHWTQVQQIQSRITRRQPIESSKKPVQFSTLPNPAGKYIYSNGPAQDGARDGYHQSVCSSDFDWEPNSSVYCCIYTYIECQRKLQNLHIALGKYPLDHPCLIWWVSGCCLPPLTVIRAWLTKTTAGIWGPAVGSLPCQFCNCLGFGDLQCGNVILIIRTPAAPFASQASFSKFILWT